MPDKEKIDVMISTIAVLRVPSEQSTSLDQEELGEVMRRPLSVVQSPAALMITSQRDQIEAALAGNKTNIRDLSGRQEYSESKVPDVLHFFIRKFTSVLTSYGVNFVVAVPCPDAALWIGDNILSPEIAARTGKKLIGQAATLKFAVGNKTWTVKLEPGGSEVINVDLNASEETEELPGPDDLRKELQSQFDALLAFLDGLGL